MNIYYSRSEDMGTKGLERFLKAQSEDYETAYEEMSKGKKRSHWIWYIYPQIKGLGISYMDQEYSIKSIQEALDYINNETLFKRLKEITKLLLKIEHNNIKEVMWYPDDLKLRSSMTLFSVISGHSLFDKVIDKFYEGEKDLKTIKILKNMLDTEKNKLEPNIYKIIEKRVIKEEKEGMIKAEKKLEEEKRIKEEKERKKKEEKEKEEQMKLNLEKNIKSKSENLAQNPKIAPLHESDLNKIQNNIINNDDKNRNKSEKKNKTISIKDSSEEPMDLDEKSIQTKNSDNINKEPKTSKIVNKEDTEMKDKNINAEEIDKEPQDNIKALKEKSNFWK